MKTTPLISIVLCTYNGAQYLQEQINSLLQQTYKNIEIIVCDDVSTDGTAAILDQYSTDRRFRIVFNKKNLGYSKNFGQAALLANGEMIAFCDQDDIWLPDKLQKSAAAIDQFSMVFSDSMLINKKGESLKIKLSHLRHLQTFSHTKSLLFFNMVSGHTMLIKKEVLVKAIPIPEGQFHDWWMAVTAGTMQGGLYLNEPLTLYRQHQKTVTVNIVEHKLRKSRKRAERYKTFQKELAWMQAVANHTTGDDKKFHQQVLDLYKRKEKEFFVWPLFFFLLGHRKIVFHNTKKTYLSQIVEIRKMARGERPA